MHKNCGMACSWYIHGKPTKSFNQIFATKKVKFITAAGLRMTIKKGCTIMSVYGIWQLCLW